MACLIWQRCRWGKRLPFESVTFLSSIFITLWWWWYFWQTRSVANWTIWKNWAGPKFVPPSHSWQTFPADREASKNGRSKLKTNRNGTVSENPAEHLGQVRFEQSLEVLHSHRDGGASGFRPWHWSHPVHFCHFFRSLTWWNSAAPPSAHAHASSTLWLSLTFSILE